MQTTIIIASSVLLFAIFLCLYFRVEVRKLFPRIKSIGAAGVSLSEAQSKSAEETKLTFEKQFDMHSRSPVLISKEEEIWKELDQRGISTEEERVKLLVRALATRIIDFECERASLLIFGSQLELLVEINAHQDGQKIQTIKDWYSTSVQSQYSDLQNYAFSEYIGFLINRILLQKEGDSVVITQFGKEFLQYLVRNGQTHRRKN